MSADGVQSIIEQIEKSAGTSVSANLSEAKEKVDAVLTEAGKQAGDEEQSILNRGEQESRRESQRILAEARIKARREKVKAQEEVVQQAFDKAQALLRTMAAEGRADGIEYRDVIERLIAESAVSAGAADLEVLVDPRDKAVVSADLLNKIAGRVGQVSLKLSDEPLSCMGGVVVRSLDGTVRVENTFESRIERFRETIRTRVAKELFPQE